MEMMTQLWIAATGMTAVGMSQTRSAALRKWASVLGLIGQPAWFYATFSAGQWGIFAMCFIYTGLWAMGFYNNWIKEPGHD